MKICAVIVTYNRLDKLKNSLKCFSDQLRKADEVIVVDNASTDGTSDWLSGWKEEVESFKKTVINTGSNLGGSGGFYTGLKYASESDCDWVWVSDDDAYPRADALKVAEEFLTSHAGENISAICSVVNEEGEISLNHRKNYYVRHGRIETELIPLGAYKREFFPLNAFSYVGTIISIPKLREVGLTKKEYFIWHDDAEHSLRLSEKGHIYCVTGIVVDHDCVSVSTTLSWKEYYGNRNVLDMYKNHFGAFEYRRFVLRCIVKSCYLWIFAKNKEYARVFSRAVRDGIKGILGLDETYRPGWKPRDDRMY